MAGQLNIPHLNKNGEPIVRVQLPGFGRVYVSFADHSEAKFDANQHILESRRRNPKVKTVAADTRVIAADFDLARRADELPDA